MSKNGPVKTVSKAESAPYEKLSLLQRIGLGTGGVPDLGMQYAINNMVNPIFVVAMGVNPALVGIAMSLPRFWEMIIDPWIGRLSDRMRGPLGRRHPFMLLGGGLGGLIFAAIWWVPESWSAQSKGIWLIVMALLHFTAFSLFMVPYSALLGEICSNAIERTRIMAMRTVFTSICTVALGWLYWLSQRSVFHDPSEGMRWIGIAFGLIMAVCAVVPTLVCPRSRIFHAGRAEPEAEKGFAVLCEIFRVQEFRGLILTVICLLASFTLVDMMGFYVGVYYVFGGDTKAAAALTGVSSLAICIAGITTSMIMGKITAIFGNWNTLRFFLLVGLMGKLSAWFTMRPEWPYMTVISSVLTNVGLVAFWIFMPSLTGRISNMHERRSGKSWYGSFYAFYNVSIKVAGSLALLFTGFFLNLTGFQVTLGAQQPEFTITMLRSMLVFGPATGLAIALLLLRKVMASLQSEEERLDAVDRLKI